MSALSRYWPALLSVVPVLVLLAAGFFWTHKTVDAAIRQAIKKRDVDLSYAGRLREVAAPFVKGTRYADKINTTDEPQADRLNLYVVKTPEAIERGLTCNCAYLGERTIVCDKAFFATFSDTLAYKTTDPAFAILAKVNAKSSQALASWLVGHEIGHALLHDADGNYLRDVFSGNSDAARRREDEADTFFVSRVPQSEHQFVSFTLTNFVFQTFVLGYHQQLDRGPNAGLSLIKPSADGIHDPWPIRALNLAKMIGRLDSKTGADSEFFPSLEKKIRIDPAGFDSGTLCKGESLRRAADELTRERQQNSAAARVGRRSLQ
jgi:hypothetical protein